MRGSGAARCPSPRQGARESCHRRAESEVRCEGLRCVGLYPQGGLGRARNIAGAPEAPGMDGRLDAWTDAGCAGVEVPSGATGHEYRVPEVAETERGHRDAEKQRGWVRPDGAQRGGRTGGTSRARRTLQNPSRSPRSTAGQGLSGLMAAQSAVCFPRRGELRALPRGGAGGGRQAGGRGRTPARPVDRGHSRPSSHRWPETLVLFSSFRPQGSCPEIRTRACFLRGRGAGAAARRGTPARHAWTPGLNLASTGPPGRRLEAGLE